MIIIILLFNIVLSAKKQCGTIPHTTYYTTHCCPITKQNFFYPNTLPIRTDDRCTPYTNPQLRDEYDWIKSSDQVEHIIDTNNGPIELTNCNKNIRGNLVIAIGTWNNQVGQLCWDDVDAEKRLVYGNETVDFAYESVKLCCEINNNYHIMINVICSVILVIFLIMLSITIYKEYDFIRLYIAEKFNNSGNYEFDIII